VFTHIPQDSSRSKNAALPAVYSLGRKLKALIRYRRLLALLALVLILGVGVTVVSSTQIPTFSIQSVVPDQTVTIQTSGFPANQVFTVTMGPIGTRGVNGTVVGTTNSGAGGSFTATYTIPAQLRGAAQISIRLQSPQGYFSYNWFYNVTGGTSPGPAPSPGYTGIPTFSIVSVDPNKSVEIQTNNYPANQVFTVTMGEIGTQGIGGITVGTFNSGAGGTLKATFNIPAQLSGRARIAIRAQTAHANPYFSYNWFNNVAGGSTGGGTTTPPTPGYTGIPTFKICRVTGNQNVTITTTNFPAGQTFTVTMGPMGTRGIGGTVVGTLASGSGGALTATFNIPAHLQGSQRIAIRAQTSHANPYFAYNWFYNATAAVC
jgi:hypothetical protein